MRTSTQTVAKPTHDQLLQAVKAMPAFPESVNKIIDLASDINCSAKQLVRVIERDPVVTVKVLQMVNSSFYCLPRKLTSAHHAVAYLGLNTVKNLAVGIAAVGILSTSGIGGLNTNAFLHHSLATSVIARRLGMKLKDKHQYDVTEFFVAGLVHDFGKLVLMRNYAEIFEQSIKTAQQQKRPLHEVEQELMGIDHAQIGGVLGNEWHLPEHLTVCMREHHCDDHRGGVLLDCVIVANHLSKVRKIGSSGNSFVPEDLPERVIHTFGNRTLEMIDRWVGDISAEYEDAKALAA
ncbi:MAG: HDOD domain-containing protein [Mariprofundales bacterium]|nr:HDOD domain-containing protein [Mariprofundales bacterium]